MYDPYEEFETQDKPLDERVKQTLEAEMVQSEQTIKTMEAADVAAEQGLAPGTPAAAAAGQPQQPQEQKTPEQQKEESEPWDAGDYARNIAEGAFAAPTGVVDFGVDLINKIPGVDIPKIPKFKSDLMQSARELSSIILPTVFLTRGLGVVAKGANAKFAWKLGQGELAKFVGEAGLAAGAGAFVDGVNTLNEKDDNLQGSLKKMFPKHFSWISDDWATLDSDSPDVKRAKNVNEGVGLGIFTDFLVGAAKMLKAVKGTKSVTGYVPRGEDSKNFWAQVAKKDGDAEATVLDAASLRETAKDELGDYRLAKGKFNGDEAVFGISTDDVFDVEEQGIRSVDELGVMSAAVDQTRISQNIGTLYGRLSSIVGEGALKYGLNLDSLTKRELVMLVKDQIKEGGKFDYLLDNRKLPWEEIDKASTDLAQVMLDPRMDTGMIKQTLDQFMTDVDGMRQLAVNTKGDIGYGAALKAVSGYLDQYMDMDALKAQAFLNTSMAGQVSDIAEGARIMDGTAAIERAQEQILDRVEYLMVEKGLANYVRGAGLNNLKLMQRLIYAKNPKRLAEVAENARAQTDDALANIIPRAKQVVNTIRDISKERPEFLRPLSMAYEFTDGNVDTMSKLNNFVDQSLSDMGKAFVDGQPEIPNVIVQGYWSNIYNSVLTSISTPMKAAFGNAALLLERPFAVMGGAIVGGDIKTLKRGWYQYSAVADSLRKGLSHMTMVYRKAASDPTSVGYIMRDDIVVKNEQHMEVLEGFARAAEQRGESGPMVLYHKAEALNDLANHPWLRFGANAMTALDGFARAVIANGEARGRAYDKFIDGGRKLDADGMRKAVQDHYNEMFDKSGMITDKAVDYASREIALNLDNPGVDAISAFIARYPAIKPFMMFPRTSANIISMANKHSPISIFASEYNKLARPFSTFTRDEVTEILTSKGMAVTEENFNALRAEVRGRKAIGTITMMSASAMFLNGHLRGNGHYDKERQRVRGELGWKPRTYKGWDGKWYSYDGLGPISDFLALTADVMDNFDSITESDLETNINKLGFLLSANLTNKSMLAGIEPMNDVLAGNPAALNRWAASFASSLAPLSGARNELGRLMAPELRELDMEFTQLLRNRNKYLDAIDPKGALPNKHDWMDGRKIGYSENIFVRAWNAVMPMKVYDGVSEERQFLMDIEYDTRPSFNKSTKGVEYTPEERSELYQIMGKDGYFRGEVNRIMGTTEAKAWRESIKTARGNGSRVDPNQWLNLYRQLDVALDRSKRMAEVQLTNREEVLRRQYEQGLDKSMQQRGISILEWQNK